MVMKHSILIVLCGSLLMACSQPAQLQTNTPVDVDVDEIEVDAGYVPFEAPEEMVVEFKSPRRLQKPSTTVGKQRFGSIGKASRGHRLGVLPVRD